MMPDSLPKRRKKRQNKKKPATTQVAKTVDVIQETSVTANGHVGVQEAAGHLKPFLRTSEARDEIDAYSDEDNGCIDEARDGDVHCHGSNDCEEPLDLFGPVEQYQTIQRLRSVRMLEADQDSRAAMYEPALLDDDSGVEYSGHDYNSDD